MTAFDYFAVLKTSATIPIPTTLEPLATMFDVTPDDISLLDDEALRELVGRLCEAELVSLGHSPVAVTWGGNMTAADGGLDVRVALAPGTVLKGFVPRASTGFQVKAQDMPRSEILGEMKPAGVLRDVIKELAEGTGAYVIVSSKGSTADSALKSRRAAMREALDGFANANQLHTDFYDRTRISTWVRQHPGLVIWARTRVGRGLAGWQPYCSWVGTTEATDAEYLLDEKLRLHLGVHRDAQAQPVAKAIDAVREELAKPGSAVRLVGLSGVGKTRLAQALFDERIGTRPLAPTLAVYTNLTDNPDPQPIGLASDLMATRVRAVLVVDNCPPDLHRRLVELTGGNASTISVLTIEYDVRDDQPEGTRVVTLDTSSVELIEKLVGARYPHLSQVDARTIAEASGGNARIAIALACTVEQSDTIAGLSHEELFERLFRQRHDPSSALLLAAQSCSLVYSFRGDTLDGSDAEIPRLAAIAGQTAAETFRHVAELLRRDLVQQRGVWRAVLPHAIANRLAARALEDFPYELINAQLVEGGTPRLAKSFSRRLSFLHDVPAAIVIVRKWLAREGFLGNVASFNALGEAMFENVAPVDPEATLAALERVCETDAPIAAATLARHLSLLRSLAYEPEHFARSARMLELVATESLDAEASRTATNTFTSLFTIALSGTHASIEQRLSVIEPLLRSTGERARSLALAALDEVLESIHFTSSHNFQFGARSRDFGHDPKNEADWDRWYGAALGFIERLAVVEGVLTTELRRLVARNFRGLWAAARIYAPLEALSRKFAEPAFWREGWAACRETMRYDKDRMTADVFSRLSTLESGLRPVNLKERVEAVVLSDRSHGLDLEDFDAGDGELNSYERMDAIACELGVAAARDGPVLAELTPGLLRGGNKVSQFGRGLASACSDPHATWTALLEVFRQVPKDQRDVQLFRGFITELWDRDRDAAQALLDSALAEPALLSVFALLQSSIQLDERGSERLIVALRSGQTSVALYRNLALGGCTAQVGSVALNDLLLAIADQSGGVSIALEILYMRFHSNKSANRTHEPELLEVARELLARASFERGGQEDHEVAGIVRVALRGSEHGPIASDVARRLRHAVSTSAVSPFDYDDLLRALLEVQPEATLDTLFADGRPRREVISELFLSRGHELIPADGISIEALLAWCNKAPATRYVQAASIVAISRRPKAGGSQVWSDHATALLSHAPAPVDVLAVFVRRFRPMSWSGSRAAAIEANAQLLDSLDTTNSPALSESLRVAKAELAKEIETERRRETKEDKDRDERFE